MERAPDMEERSAKERFAEFARSGIEDAIRLGGNRIRRALRYERELDEIIDMIAQEELTAREKSELIRKIREMQLYSIRDLTSFINAIYDKVELAAPEREKKEERLEITFSDEVGRYAD